MSNINDNLDINTNLLNNYDLIKNKNIKDLKILLKKIDIDKAQKNKDKLQILNYIVLKKKIDKGKFLSSIKRERLLEFDTNSKNKHIEYILKNLLKNSTILNLSINEIEYFTSKKNLLYFTSEIYELSQAIRKKIKEAEKSFIRDLLFIADVDFVKYNDKLNISKEDFTEFISELIYLYYQIHGKEDGTNLTFSKNFNANNYKNLIDNMAIVKQFKIVDKMIDSLDYICIKEKKIFQIKGKDFLFEKARVHGFYHTDNQRLNNHIQVKEYYPKALSIAKLSEKMYEATKDSLFTFKEEPIPRYVYEFPMLEEIKEMILSERLFLEELMLIAEIDIEYNITDLNKFEFTEKLTIWDLIIIKRFFFFYFNQNSIFLLSLLEENQNNLLIVYNSWVKALTRDNLIKMMTFVIDKEKVEAFIDNFSWSIESNEILDLQYTPLLKNNFDYYFPMGILINSNLFRNSLFKNKIRPHDGNDFLSESIGKELKSKFDNVEIEVKFKKYGFDGDFDVLALIENTLYIFECKNTINPVGWHELRTTYKDNVIKGFSQLDKARKAFSTPNFISYINKRFNWKININDLKIITCVVLKTRMFNGYTNGIHHVRAFDELLNFIKYGEMTITNIKDNKIKTLNLWTTDTISNEDLYQYIENRKLHKVLYECMTPIENKIKLGRQTIAFGTFEFNAHLFNQSICNTFKEKE
jgi:hypothetical protein